MPHSTRLRGLGLAVLLGCACVACQPDAPGQTVVCESDADCSGATVCLEPACVVFEGHRPFRDAWREELVLPADGLRRLILGGVAVADNFSNRSDIEVRYVADSSEIVVELQRFTVARDEQDAEAAFARMSLWAFSLEQAQRPDASIAPLACDVSGVELCQIRNYYEGQLQPVRDGVNLRVSLPAGWDGALELATEDNLVESDYPDRGDVRVDGLAGPLTVTLDSGRVALRLADDIGPFPGCALEQECVAGGLAPDCGCSEFAQIEITARVDAAASITVDVPANSSYVATLETDVMAAALGCELELDCASFTTCVADESPGLVRAWINRPGPPALADAGIRIDLRAGRCASIDHADQPLDRLAGPASELRGDLRLCSGCLH